MSIASLGWAASGLEVVAGGPDRLGCLARGEGRRREQEEGGSRKGAGGRKEKYTNYDLYLCISIVF